MRTLLATLAIVSFFTIGGCSSKNYLMPTPGVYTNEAWNPFADVPPALQGDTINVLYITDRAVEQQTDDNWTYGYGRSRSAAFGEAVVKFGEDLSWDEIVAASRTDDRDHDVEVTLASTHEIARFGKTPPRLVLTAAELAMQHEPGVDPAQAPAAEAKFREDMAARLAQTPCKEVFIFVHGFNNSFEEAVETTAELWHFLGREGVPVCYTWPAGIGVFRAYQYTIASTDFTIYHCKQALRLIASCPEVERVNIIAHSRGTAVTTDSIRELYLEIRGTADAQKTLKLGTVVLAAADLDLDVTVARDASERIGRACERTVLYISEHDQALGFSAWLFGGMRLGSAVDLSLFDDDEIHAIRGNERLQLIHAQVSQLGSYGHSYFMDNTAISSDLMLMMRYDLRPGAEHGRPLGANEIGLWVIDDDYPGLDWTPPIDAD